MYEKSREILLIGNQQPRPEGRGMLVLQGMDCMRDLIPESPECYVIQSALKGRVLNPLANKKIVKKLEFSEKSITYRPHTSSTLFE